MNKRELEKLSRGAMILASDKSRRVSKVNTLIVFWLERRFNFCRVPWCVVFAVLKPEFREYGIYKQGERNPYLL